MLSKNKTISIIALTFIIGLGCSDQPTQSCPDPPISPPTPYEMLQTITPQIYHLACEVCRAHMYHPETAMFRFRPLDGSYIAVTSEGLFMVVSTVVGDNLYGLEITSGFIATFQIYKGEPVIYSFMSWEWDNRPMFKPAP